MLISLSLMLVIFMIPCVALAEEYSCDVTLPVKVEVTGEDEPADIEFKVILTNEDQDAPMPEQTEGTVKGSGELVFGPMTYTVPDDYQYRISQVKGNEANWTYDTAEYLVTVRVVNNEEGGLEAEVWAVKEGSKDKVDQIRFENKYVAPVIPDQTPQKGDQTNITVLVSLMAVSMLVMAAMIFMSRRNLKDYQ